MLTRYLAGADGGHSLVRKQAGIAFAEADGSIRSLRHRATTAAIRRSREPGAA